MRTWRAMDRAPHDGRWIIAIHRDDPDRRAVIRWDPQRLGDPEPWHVASCQHSYPADAFTDWMDFPDCPAPETQDRGGARDQDPREGQAGDRRVGLTPPVG